MLTTRSDFRIFDDEMEAYVIKCTDTPKYAKFPDDLFTDYTFGCYIYHSRESSKKATRTLIENPSVAAQVCNGTYSQQAGLCTYDTMEGGCHYDNCKIPWTASILYRI